MLRTYPREPEEAENRLRDVFSLFSKKTDNLGMELLHRDTWKKTLEKAIGHLKCITNPVGVSLHIQDGESVKGTPIFKSLKGSLLISTTLA